MDGGVQYDLDVRYETMANEAGRSLVESSENDDQLVPLSEWFTV